MQTIDNGMRHLGRAAILAAEIVRHLRNPSAWFRLAVEEAVRQTYGTLPLVIFLSILGGSVASQQTGFQFEGSLPYWVIGSVVAAGSITELAPLLTGIAMVAVTGTRIAAELASMKVSEQIDALELMGRNPIPYLVVPRVLGGLFSGMVLVSLSLAVAIFSGWIVAILVTPVTTADFWFGVRYFTRDFIFYFALIKASSFGIMTAFLSTYIGLEASGGSSEIGHTTRAAAVTTISSVLVLDASLAPLLKIFPG